VAVLGCSDESELAGGGAVVGCDEEAGVDAGGFHELSKVIGCGVLTDDADSADFGVEGCEHGADVGSAAEAELFVLVVKDKDRGLGGDALGVSVEVFVEHHVADHDDFAGREALDDLDEAAVHWW
jgi:hypothetical protein